MPTSRTVPTGHGWRRSLATTDAADGFLKGARHLIVDRDPLYSAHFKELLASADVELLRLPGRPNLNGNRARDPSGVTNASAAYWPTIGEKPRSAADRVFGQDAWDSRALLSIVLVRLPDLEERLRLRRNRSLYSRMHQRLAIGTLTPEDTADSAD